MPFIYYCCFSTPPRVFYKATQKTSFIFSLIVCNQYHRREPILEGDTLHFQNLGLLWVDTNTLKVNPISQRGKNGKIKTAESVLKRLTPKYGWKIGGCHFGHAHSLDIHFFCFVSKREKYLEQTIVVRSYRIWAFSPSQLNITARNIILRVYRAGSPGGKLKMLASTFHVYISIFYSAVYAYSKELLEVPFTIRSQFLIYGGERNVLD